MALDVATLSFLAKLQTVATKPRHLMSVDEARTAFSRIRALLANGSEVGSVGDLWIPVAGGLLRSRLLIPVEQPVALLVYFHGGGWVVGSIEEFEPFCRDLAVAAGIAVAMVEYRKAPEHPFPIPVDDAWAAVSWFGHKRRELLGSELPLLVGGDSAGANLAIATTLRAREHPALPLVAQLLAYPVTDCRFDRASYADPANQLMLTEQSMRWYWSHYVPEETDRLTPLASPCRASDLRGLPPAVIVTAEHDVLRDEGEEYGRRLREADVPVQAQRFAGQMHGFLMMRGIVPGSDAGLAFSARSLRELLARTG